ncbi:MAG: hypothetical protein WAN59_03135 [Candidatus Baltobacteraceae bacterium]
MKCFAVAIAITIAISSPSVVHAQYLDASCSQMLDSHTRAENRAYNEMEANDFGSMYADAQSAAEYRADCADSTTGVANQWNRVFEADDYWDLAIAAGSDNSPWADEEEGYREKAHELANELLGERLPPSLREFAQIIWDSTKSAH